MESLLEPISADTPTGVDLSYDPIYNDLAVLIQGTPDNQFEENSAKEPNWNAIRKMSEEGLKRSKDLQIAIYFAVAQMQTAGVEGAARGLEIIAGITRQYWDTLFPNLDPDDNDPTQRVNIISQLAVEPGSFGDPIKFIERFTAAPIFTVPGLGPVTIAYLTNDPRMGAGPGVGKLPELAAANAEGVKAGEDALRRIAAAIHAVDDFLVQTLGRGSAPSFDVLIKTVDRGLRPFDELAGQAAVADPGDAGETAAVGSAGAAKSGAAISGDICSPEDVRKMLRKIRDYYEKNEPSSPVPLLLQRVEKLVGLSYLELLMNLTPDARSTFDMLMGPQDEPTE